MLKITYKNISTRLVSSVLLVAVIFLTPGTVMAQSASEADQLAYLKQLLSTLQLQLEDLLRKRRLEVLNDRYNWPIIDPVIYDEGSFAGNFDSEVLARYEVKNMSIDSPEPLHEKYVARMAKLIPDEYHDYVVEFVIFESDNDDSDAFVEYVLPYTKEWRYGVNVAEFKDTFNSELANELIIHEFAHMFSLDEALTKKPDSSCHELIQICANNKTIYGKYIEEFWEEDQLDKVFSFTSSSKQDSKLWDFYQKNQKSFVTSYAASSPAEDFAESFAFYVLYEEGSYGPLAREKIDFFKRFSLTKNLKDEIIDNL